MTQVRTTTSAGNLESPKPANNTGREFSPLIKGESEGDFSRVRGRWTKQAALLCLLILTTACTDTTNQTAAVPGIDNAEKTTATARAERRLFDGAPPVIPHEHFGAACLSCHGERGMSVPGVGFSPPSPHGNTAGMGAVAAVDTTSFTVAATVARCEQCHVYQLAGEPWRKNSFAGLRQDLREGRRLNPLAPPVIPHRVFMRENCHACHTGPAAREEIRTDHPDRPRCQQCHVEQVTTTQFVRAGT